MRLLLVKKNQQDQQTSQFNKIVAHIEAQNLLKKEQNNRRDEFLKTMKEAFTSSSSKKKETLL